MLLFFILKMCWDLDTWNNKQWIKFNYVLFFPFKNSLKKLIKFYLPLFCIIFKSMLSMFIIWYKKMLDQQNDKKISFLKTEPSFLIDRINIFKKEIRETCYSFLLVEWRKKAKKPKIKIRVKLAEKILLILRGAQKVS